MLDLTCTPKEIIDPYWILQLFSILTLLHIIEFEILQASPINTLSHITHLLSLTFDDIVQFFPTMH